MIFIYFFSWILNCYRKNLFFFRFGSWTRARRPTNALIGFNSNFALTTDIAIYWKRISTLFFRILFFSLCFPAVTFSSIRWISLRMNLFATIILEIHVKNIGLNSCIHSWRFGWFFVCVLSVCRWPDGAEEAFTIVSKWRKFGSSHSVGIGEGAREK